MALLLGPGGQLWMAHASMGLFGTGLGFASASLLIAVQTVVPWEMRGLATASNMFFRTIGGSLGVALMGGVLTFHLHHQAGYTEGTAEQLLGPHHGLGLSASTLASLAEALLRALTVNFWLIAAFAALAFCASILFPTFRPNASPVVTVESNLD
jgi:hypothetical protein